MATIKEINETSAARIPDVFDITPLANGLRGEYQGKLKSANSQVARADLFGEVVKHPRKSQALQIVEKLDAVKMSTGSTYRLYPSSASVLLKAYGLRNFGLDDNKFFDSNPELLPRLMYKGEPIELYQE